jgi:UDP-N-acetylmuramoyl-tripeptide--D-alanyl-D-alanine ligase
MGETAAPSNTGPLWSSAEIANVTGGRVDGAPFQAYGVSIDSREIDPGDLFVALQGERDGHDFAEAALARGAAAALASRPVSGPFIAVQDTLRALERLGEAARDRAVLARRAAVTGSVGKTSVTQAIAAAIALAGPSHASVKSYNNHLGVPLTLARMPRETLRAVFEIGMNHAGEITPLSGFVRPHVAVVTVVGPVHVENFPDGEIGVARAKAEIFAGMSLGGVAVLNADDRWFELLAGAAHAQGLEVRTFGMAPGADARLTRVEAKDGGAVVEAVVGGQPVSLDLAQSGRHWGPNALATLLAAEALETPRDAVVEALARFRPLAGRGEETRLALPQGEVVLIDESYNANPVSMRAALSTLAARRSAGRRIAVLTDMLELSDSPAVHAALAQAVLESDVDLAFLAGPDMKALHDVLPDARRGAWRATAEALAPVVVEALEAGDVVMIKGSKGSKASRVVEALKAARTPAGFAAGKAG